MKGWGVFFADPVMKHWTCGVVQGLSEKFKEKDKNYTGVATMDYETFMLMVLPFIVAWEQLMRLASAQNSGMEASKIEGQVLFG